MISVDNKCILNISQKSNKKRMIKLVSTASLTYFQVSDLQKNKCEAGYARKDFYSKHYKPLFLQRALSTVISRVSSYGNYTAFRITKETDQPSRNIVPKTLSEKKNTKYLHRERSLLRQVPLGKQNLHFILFSITSNLYKHYFYNLKKLLRPVKVRIVLCNNLDFSMSSSFKNKFKIMYTTLKNKCVYRELRRIMKNEMSSFYVSFNVVSVNTQ